jgi:hypothetical protein
MRKVDHFTQLFFIRSKIMRKWSARKEWTTTLADIAPQGAEL